ncbi:MAG: hypothetical protein IKC42_03915 [Alistipes sp.]|nr:hypothetical protein [Alistipes sp.]
MKRKLSILFMAVLTVGTLSAQVEKEVEVTKTYAPRLQSVRKMLVEPNMVDTIALRPEIDYTITPQAFASALTISQFRPASVTYWEYSPKYPFYVKAAIGYPLQSEVDAYASTERADVGYFCAYVHHRGRFGKIKVTDPTVNQVYNNKADQMTNRVGVTGGKYLGRYTFAGDIYYESDVYSRYPYNAVDEKDPTEINFENINLKLNFGDTFSDMSRLNFSIYAGMDFYNDKSQQQYFADPLQPTYDNKFQQLSANAGIRIARRLGGRGSFEAAVGYEGYYGLKSLDAYSNTQLSAQLMLGYKSKKRLQFKIGARYVYDAQKSEALPTRHRVLPYLYVGLNVRDNGRFVPYMEMVSELENNSYQLLQQRNPYVAVLGYPSMATVDLQRPLENSRKYSVRFGFTGHSKNSKFAYRLYANTSFAKDALYWFLVNRAFYGVTNGRLNEWSINAAFEYKPLASLYFEAKASGRVYTSFGDVEVARPAYDAELGIRYTHRRFAISATAHLIGESQWSSILEVPDGADATEIFKANAKNRVTIPTAVDVGLKLDVFISKHWTMFVEGRNLANMNIYRWAYYRELGINCLVGFKVQF